MNVDVNGTAKKSVKAKRKREQLRGDDGSVTKLHLKTM